MKKRLALSLSMFPDKERNINIRVSFAGGSVTAQVPGEDAIDMCLRTQVYLHVFCLWYEWFARADGTFRTFEIDASEEY